MNQTPQDAEPARVPEPSERRAEGSAAVPAAAQPVGTVDTVQAVGAELARLRAQRGWSIDDISARLKVHPSKLRALEAGDLSHLPDITFAVGVVRSYAKTLGADPKPLADALRRGTGTVSSDLKLPAGRGADLPRGHVPTMKLKTSRTRRPWFWAVAAAALGIVVLAMYRTDKEPGNWLARLRGESAETGGAVRGTPATDAGGHAGAASEGVAQPGREAAANPGLPPVAATAAGLAHAPEGPADRTGAAASTVTVPAASGAAALAPGQNILRFEFSKDSWVGVHQGDGKEVYSGTVHAGTPQDVQGVGPFKVVIGNRAGLTALHIDGKAVESTRIGGERGNVARFTVP